LPGKDFLQKPIYFTNKLHILPLYAILNLPHIEFIMEVLLPFMSKKGKFIADFDSTISAFTALANFLKERLRLRKSHTCNPNRIWPLFS
jgi:hypothetical protein